MVTRGVQAFAQASRNGSNRDEDEGVVEIPLLLPHWQVEALESAAHEQGLTAGEMIRHLLLDYLARHGAS
jgi:hypothetical protein